MKYKVGDKLRLIRNCLMNNSLEIGDECEIVRIEDYRVYLRFEGKLEEYIDEYGANQWITVHFDFGSHRENIAYIEETINIQFELINR